VHADCRAESTVFAPIRIAVVHSDNLSRARRQTAGSDELEKAYEARPQWMVFLRMDKIFDSGRSDPRFIAPMKKVKKSLDRCLYPE
jgi:hypothetical protein